MGSKGPRGGIPAVARAGLVETIQQQMQGLPGSFLPSPHFHPSGCPSGTSGNLPEGEKSQTHHEKPPSSVPQLSFVPPGSLAEGWASPGELP